MRFETLIALRYLKAKRKQAVVSLITVISILGVAAGVAALVIALAINAGFQEDLQEKLLGAQAHVTLVSTADGGIRDYMDLVHQIEEMDGVEAASPALYQAVLLTNGFRQRGAYMKGVVPELEARRSPILGGLVSGSLEEFDSDSVLVGEELANFMGSYVGDEIRIMSAEGRLSPMGIVPLRSVLEVSGIFKSGLYDFDAGYIYVQLGAAQRLLGGGDVVTSIEVALDDLNDSDRMGPEIVAAVGESVDFTDWKTQNAAIFQALKLERLVMFITIGLIVIVASLNIVVTLVMMVMEKTRDIAVLVSMGATRENIRRVFVAQGVVIGVVGTMLGLGIGNLSSYLADTYRLVSLAPDVYSIAYVPFRLSYIDSGIVGAGAILISYLATIYPSSTASSLDPAEAFRYE
jgi:lipoprotein-releasing system permease protein